MSDKKEKRCKECEGMGKDCKCPKKTKRGYFSFGNHDHDDTTMDTDYGVENGSDGGGMSEGARMPEAPTDSDKNMQGSSKQRKEKTLSDFRAAADEAKKRKKYKAENDELAVTRMTKGVRFFDKKGSGYLKGGKKTYD